MAKPSKQRLIPYKLLMIALYGQMKWISRDSLGVVRLPVPKLATHLSLRSHDVHDALKTLKTWGLIETYGWWGSFAEITPIVPKGMCLITNAPAIRVEKDSMPMILEADGDV